MVKIDYISTTDINKVAKIHSNKKYVNWNLKIVGNEYRFYPPIVIDSFEDEFDDFDFSKEDDDISNLDTVLNNKSIKNNLPMFGELWDNATKFFTNDKFRLVSCIEESINDKKIRNIKRGMNSVARIEKYKKDVSRNLSRGINKDKIMLLNSQSDAYKLYKIKQNSNCIAKIRKYKIENISNTEHLNISYNQSTNNTLSSAISSILKKSDNDIEILTLD